MIEKATEIMSWRKKIIVDLDIDYFMHFFQCFGPVSPIRLAALKSNLTQVKKLIAMADFVTIATSPDFFSDQTETKDKEKHFRLAATQVVE